MMSSGPRPSPGAPDLRRNGVRSGAETIVALFRCHDGHDTAASRPHLGGERRRLSLGNCGPFQDGAPRVPDRARGLPTCGATACAPAPKPLWPFSRWRDGHDNFGFASEPGRERAGAGRPRLKNRQSSVPHRPRPEHNPRHPVHITLRARKAIPYFDTHRVRRHRDSDGDSLHLDIPNRGVLRAGHYVHAIVESDDKRALGLGVAGLRIRSAKALNRVFDRTGPVWSGKYHARELATPRATRTAIVYVLQNWKKHIRGVAGIDPCSSGPWFDGWKEAQSRRATPSPAARPRTWLATRGWRERGGGAIGLHEHPASER